MAKIKQLSAHIADLIAAGEVVERPASCMKELLENAIDAGAHSISAEIQNGGMTYMRVTDDGCGMAPEDAETAFLRHATSKIREKEDLDAIGTLGFRGEALAAISSVSRIDLLTKTADAESGTSLHLEGGTVTERAPVGCPVGTTILVRDLFFNTPARMKFMKSDIAEASAITAVIAHQALAHPEVSFRFLKDGQEQLRTAGDGDLFGAIYSVLGRQSANELVKVESHLDPVSVSGYVSKPTATRGTRSNQQFFVNGRFVKSKLLCAALEEAYKNQMMVGRFPSCVLCITLPLSAVDVNVHPAKTEVKFLREREVFDAVHYAVLAALNKTPAKPEMKLPQPKTVTAQPAPQQNFFKTMTASEFRQSVSEKKPSAVGIVSEPVRLPTVEKKPEMQPPKPVIAEKPVVSEKNVICEEPVIPEKTEIPEIPEPKKTSAAEAPQQQELPLAEMPYRVIGEALDTYILVEQNETLLFIDKHAAHERILFEKLKAQEQPVMPQVLLMPIAADLSAPEAAVVLENSALLQSLGFLCEDFGDGSVLIRQIPSDLPQDDAAQSLQEIAAKLLTGRSVDAASLRDGILHTIACKAAIKAGWHTEPQERDYLVRQVLSREDLKYCPHGRPICTTLTKTQLERQFKR